MTNKIAGKTIEEWKNELPLLQEIIDTKEVFWVNSQLESCNNRIINSELGIANIEDAEQRLLRFAPYLATVFPETKEKNGIIESELVNIPKMQQQLSEMFNQEIAGNLYLKCDSHLPISGSVKARGGIYEILKVAEEIAFKHGMLSITDDYSILADEKFKTLFSNYSIVVGSTGNLGLSIGIMSAQLGFKVVVHMSTDAKEWKKDLLRQKGAIVVEHNSDYGKAVEAGRQESQKDPNSHFVDDENSTTLFLGYAVAAKRLQKQLSDMKIAVDQDHPLFVYLPCGVGGAPGGITFGLRTVFGDNVHCFYAEPTHSPAMLLGLMTRKHSEVSAQEFGVDNMTAADGLAVGRPSGFVGKALEKDISGVFTVQDECLYRILRKLADSEGIFLEPSAVAGFIGPVQLHASSMGQDYLKNNHLEQKMQNATHILWATGGGMVPKDVMDDFYRKGAMS
ncbi:D-serine ammonia-lyase [Paenibacillus sp. KQZ6P-2]|uniref:Probable D-serine dehydratase n=1 Tax=Paenibacillus mangrovi TaxID=2931978 RepID=A0A9X2B1B9_9BACL|nr:D-serine ammonia-lyase [Paenibacillus mangrovi]MCJ8010740.1 D-serine ammonia-lyase [Paenibacillus mangrovi]